MQAVKSSRNRINKISPRNHSKAKNNQQTDKKAGKPSQGNSASKKKHKSKSKNNLSPSKKTETSLPAAKIKNKSKQKNKKNNNIIKNKQKKPSLEQLPSKIDQTTSQIEHNYRKEIRESQFNVRWIIPRDQLLNTALSTFWDFVSKEDFQDMNNLTMNFLHYVCKKRIIRDKDFNFLYDGLVKKFPDKQSEIQSMLFEVLTILDT